MKIKVNQVRTYDDDGYRRRAACLCFRSECETEILLVSSSRYHDLWIVPGGGQEPGEDPATTAVREVNEEAGVVGKLGRLLDIFKNIERKTKTYVFTLTVEKLNDEYEDAKGIGRMRRWFSLPEANEQLLQHKPIQQGYLKKLFDDQDHLLRSSRCRMSCKILPYDVCRSEQTNLLVQQGCQHCDNGSDAINTDNSTVLCSVIAASPKTPNISNDGVTTNDVTIVNDKILENLAMTNQTMFS